MRTLNVTKLNKYLSLKYLLCLNIFFNQSYKALSTDTNRKPDRSKWCDVKSRSNSMAVKSL